MGDRMLDLETLRRENAEHGRTISRMSRILIDTANALKGEPGPLLWHDWKDLPKVAAATVAARDEAHELWEGEAEIANRYTRELEEMTAERDRLQTALDAAISYVFALEHQKEAVVVRARQSYEAALDALDAGGVAKGAT